ncbi:MAG: hypothetical protein IJ020_04470 [Bacteroidaceae bacterium]|nr:hypothetical protein [Bacteroidaceae bacterium]
MKWRIFSTFVKFLSAEISPASVSGALIWSFSLFLVEDEKNSVNWQFLPNMTILKGKKAVPLQRL